MLRGVGGRINVSGDSIALLSMRSLKSYRGKCKDANTVKADSCCLEKRPLFLFVLFAALSSGPAGVRGAFHRLRIQPSGLVN